MTRPADAQHGVLVLSCQDAPGIVHAVSGLLVQERCSIVESHQFDSPTSGVFYMRVEFAHVDGTPPDLPRLRSFYSALGWEVAIEAEDFCAFQLRGALLALFPLEKLASDGQAQAAAHARGMRGFSLGINVDRPEQVDEAIAAAESAGATVTKAPSAPAEFEGRHAYFADPEENYWEVVYLKGDGPGQQAIDRALRQP